MPNRPNILLIMSDQHQAGVMGCAGDQWAETPALDRLATAGALFSSAYCTYPLCGPSRMAFMTARHPHELRCWSNENQLDSDAITFAHGLLVAGYETVISGRMHFVGQDQLHGFTRRLIADVPESAYLSAGWKLQRVLGDLVDTPGMSLPSLVKSGPGRTGYHAYDEAVTRATVEWLRERGKAREERPFLLTVGYVSPHCPFVAPPEDFARYADRISVDDLPEAGEVSPLLAAMRRDFGVELPPPREAQWRARVAYYGLCSFLDRQVGALLAALEDAGLARNTLIVYTSDHGEQLGEHGLWWKSTFYEGATRVPLLISWPGHLPLGNRLAQPVSLLDIGPTLLDLVGAPPLAGATGVSLRPLLDGVGDDRPVFAEYVFDFEDRIVPARMVREGQWKFNYFQGLHPELFDLANDPGETTNLVDQPKLQALRERLTCLALAGWDPEDVARRVAIWRAEAPRRKAWLDAVQPAEPDPLWFDTPPANWVNQVRPDWATGGRM